MQISIEDASLTAEEVSVIRSDIANMATPSWITSVPYDLGAARHGKLKADQWRILATVYLPISLQRLWDTNSPRSTPLRKKLLDATMALISAVIIATSHKTSRKKADLYLQHMQSYLQLMQELLPRYNFRAEPSYGLTSRRIPSFLRTCSCLVDIPF